MAAVTSYENALFLLKNQNICARASANFKGHLIHLILPPDYVDRSFMSYGAFMFGIS